MVTIANGGDRAERYEGLKALVERLASRDLTLAEAKTLRGRLSGLLMGEGRPEEARP